MVEKFDVIIIGAGAAGLMCAIEAGKRHRKVLLLDHANKPGKKILMSGGGRCNFTNYNITPDAYISHNPHFCKSALSRYTQWDFIELVKKHKIPFHEKTLGQLFCDNKSRDILNLLLNEADSANVTLKLNTKILDIENPNQKHFKIKTENTIYHCESLVIATGGLSIPTMGASPFGYKIAEQFNLKIYPTKAGLVPFTLKPTDKSTFEKLPGVSVNSIVSTDSKSFVENILFTHRGLSGPAILQISSYWKQHDYIVIDMLPGIDIKEYLRNSLQIKLVKTILTELLPKSLIETFINQKTLNTKIAEVSKEDIDIIATSLSNWKLIPNGTEGYRTAEVTLGGVDTTALSSQTFEVNNTPGLFFIGEVLDVTGWLGGYNFQWAWSSGWAAGQVA